MDGRQVHVQYAEPASPRAKAHEPARPEVTASASNVPGLVIIEDFLTEEEEEAICRSSSDPLTCAATAAAGTHADGAAARRGAQGGGRGGVADEPVAARAALRPRLRLRAPRRRL